MATIFQPRPVRTHIPEKVPKWFQDYVDSNDEWCNAAYNRIRKLENELHELRQPTSPTPARDAGAPSTGPLGGG